MRITSGIIANQYKKNLNSSLDLLNFYGNRATTYRKFDKVSQDPVGAAKSFRLRREYLQNADYQSNLTNIDNMFTTAESAMMTINSIVQEASAGDCLQAITGTMGPDERAVIAKKLRSQQDNILAQLNTQYADRFLFGGSNQSELPFTLDAGGNLLYRGVDVNSGKLVKEDGAITQIGDMKISFGKDNGEAFNGYTVKILQDDAGMPLDSAMVDTDNKTITVNLPAGATAADLQAALSDSAKVTVSDPAALTADFSKITVGGDPAAAVNAGTSYPATDTVNLNDLANEKLYVDLGIGLKFNADGTVSEQSAFNAAMSGLKFMGYGSKNGMSNNLYTLMGQIADQLESDSFSIDSVQPFLDKFKQQESVLLAEITGMGVKTSYLEQTKLRLESAEENLTKKMLAVEYVDEAEAIMDFKQQQTAYTAALQMGTLILQPSFIDFMK